MNEILRKQMKPIDPSRNHMWTSESLCRNKDDLFMTDFQSSSILKFTI